MKQKLIAATVTGMLMVSGAADTATASDIPESPDTIKLAMNDWTGQHVTTRIGGELLKKMGYNIEYISAGVVPQFAGIAQGNLHVQLEVWDNLVGDVYPKAVESGEIVVLGELGLNALQNWMYPVYMEEKCPGLPDYRALYECAQAFGTPETFPKGRLITYPADWGTRSRELVGRIDLPFEPIPGGSEGAMIAELKSAYATKDPILMMWWAPHWIFAEHDFNWVQWNATDGMCDEEGQSKENACGFVQAKVFKVVSGGFLDKWPAAYRLLTNIQLTNEDQNAAILEIDNKGRDLDEVVAEWLAANEERWKAWVNEAMM